MRKLVLACALAAVTGLTSFAASSSAAPMASGLALGGAVAIADGSDLVEKVRCTIKGWSDRKACDNFDYGYEYDDYVDYEEDDYYYQDRRPYYRYQRPYDGYDPYYRPHYRVGVPFIAFGFGGSGWGHGWDD